MAGNDHHLLAAALAAEASRSEGRGFSARGGNPAQVRRGIVSAVNGNGTYEVALQGAAGDSITASNVPGWGGAFEVGARVAVVIDPSRAVPWIIAGGGSGSGDGSTIIVVPTAYGG